MEASINTFLKPVPLATLWCDSTYAEVDDETSTSQEAPVREGNLTEWMLKVAPSEIVRHVQSHLRVDDVLCLAMTSFPLWSAFRLQANDHAAPFPFYAAIRSIRRANANQKDELVDAVAALKLIEKIPCVEQRIWLLMELARHRPGIQMGDRGRRDVRWSEMAAEVENTWFGLDPMSVSLTTRQNWMLAQWYAAMPPRFPMYAMRAHERAYRDQCAGTPSKGGLDARPSRGMDPDDRAAACIGMRDLPIRRWPEAFVALEARQTGPRECDLTLFMNAFDGTMPPVSASIALQIKKLRDAIDIGDEW